MLTRIEIDGFKNLLGFSAEFGPFTCIAGPNAVGKSNLFDAIEFLSLLAELPLKEAAKRIRGGGEIRDLFWTDGKNRVDQMRFAVEMLAEPVEILAFPEEEWEWALAKSMDSDDWERTTPQGIHSYRYELTLALEESEIHGVSRLRLLEESIREQGHEITQFPRFPGAGQIRDKLHATGGLGGDGSFRFHGTGATPPHHKQTTLGSPIGGEGHAVLAARREMQSWRRLALDPVSLRLPDNLDDLDEEFTVVGAHLPATIYRLAHQSHDGYPPDPEGFYARLATRLSDLVNLRHIEIDRDDKHRLLSLEVEDADGGKFPARALSDGTLRFLVLATLSFVRKQRLLCIEEPENGIHPGRIQSLVDLIRDLATNPEEDLQYETTLRQVIINTHSSDLVRAVYKESDADILVATQTVIPGPFGQGAHVLRLSPLTGTWRCSDQNPGIGILPLVDYLGGTAAPRE
jgi:predicted ATPase